MEIKLLIESHRDGWGQIDDKSSGAILHNHALYTSLHLTKYFSDPVKTVISLKLKKMPTINRDEGGVVAWREGLLIMENRPMHMGIHTLHLRFMVKLTFT